MFRSSLPGRIVSLSIALALISGGLIPILGLHAPTWVPFTFLVPVVGCVTGCILAIEKHHWAVMALAVALPLTLWPYVMLLMLITTSYPQYGWGLLAGGAAMSALTAASWMVRPEPATAKRPVLT